MNDEESRTRFRGYEDEQHEIDGANHNFPKNIERLRNEFRYTREQIAEMLGVTYRDVCRWECGEDTPPIEMLPVIADIFHVSTDRLLGVSGSERETKIQKYLEDALFFSRQFCYADAIAVLRKAMLRYPADPRILCALSENLIADRKNRPGAKEEAVSLLCRVLETARDPGITVRAVLLLIRLYDSEGKHETAATYAKLLPSFESTREQAEGTGDLLGGKALSARLLCNIGLYLSAAEKAAERLRQPELSKTLSADDEQKLRAASDALSLFKKETETP